MEIKIHSDASPQCVAQHIGVWAIEQRWFQTMCGAYNAGKLQTVEKGAQQGGRMTVDEKQGIAIITLEGVLQKPQSKFGGTSTVAVRRLLRRAAADPDISGIMLSIDSPGGTVAGTDDLADDIRRINRQKPVFAHGADLVASAAMWLASQTERFSATRSTEIGSIGVLAVVYDFSEQAETLGVKVHVVSTGEFKGAFVAGTEVTAAQLADLKRNVDSINDLFLRAIRTGRKLSEAKTRELADGRVYIAGEAVPLGLVDRVQTLDEAVEDLRREIRRRATARRATESRLALLRE